MKTERLFLRGRKVSWAISDTTLIAFDRIQATVYHAYGFPNKSALDSMRKEIILCYPEKYGDWSSIISLALKMGVDSYGLTTKAEWLESSTTS